MEAPTGGKALAEGDTHSEQDHTENEQEQEYALPAPGVGHAAACHGGRYGREVVDGAEDGYELGELAARVYVGGDGAGEHDSPRASDALKKTRCRKGCYGCGETADYGCRDEHSEREDEHPLAATLVAGGAEKKLPGCQPHHAESEAELHCRRVAAEHFGHLREGREIHVDYKGPEGREEPEEDYEIDVVSF